MLPDRVSNPGPLTHESGALPIALRGPYAVLQVCKLHTCIHVHTRTMYMPMHGQVHVPVCMSIQVFVCMCAYARTMPNHPHLRFFIRSINYIYQAGEPLRDKKKYNIGRVSLATIICLFSICYSDKLCTKYF